MKATASRSLLCLLSVSTLLASCQRHEAESSATAEVEREAAKKVIKVQSAAFAPDGIIPTKCTCDGQNVSPALEWSSAPEKTRSLALIVDDPDAPQGTWTHWVLFNLPAAATRVTENVPPRETLANAACQGTNDFKKVGYGGPCPPSGSGTHRYLFKIYALDTRLGLKPGATKDQLLQAMTGHVLAGGQLIGKYSR
jgi:Raf kinase inhibitor-like YbhB/YbcL family protein